MFGSQTDRHPKVPLLPVLHLFTLWGFAIAQPLFDLLGRYPQFFVTRRIDSLELGLLVVSLSFLFPSLLGILFLLLFRLSHKTAILAQMILFALLVGLILIPVLNWEGSLPGIWMVVVAGLTGLVFVLAYRRFSSVKLLLSVLSPSVLVFPIVFLAHTPISEILPVSASPQAETGKLESMGDAVPVVMVIFDELPLFSLLDGEGNIDSERFPNFSLLANESNWYRNATTVAESTDWAVPSILNGSYPKPDRLPTYLDYPNSLFTLLSRTHELEVFESFTQICPPQLCPQKFREPRITRLRILLEDVAAIYGHLSLPAQWAKRLPDIRHGWGHFAWQRVFFSQAVAVFERFLETLQPSSTPKLYYYHGLLPHFPWLLLPSGEGYSSGSGSDLFFNQERWVENEVLVTHGFQRYLLQLGYTDRLLGRLIERLQKIGLYDRALILVLADHGTSFRPGGRRRGVDRQNFADILRVPLLVRFPGQREGVVSDAPVELIDLLPTIAEVVERPLTWTIDGISLLDKPSRRSGAKLLFKNRKRSPLMVDPRVEKLLTPAACVEGRVYPLDQTPAQMINGKLDGLVGRVYAVEMSEAEIEITGIAGDPSQGKPADGVLVFLNNDLIERAPMDQRRPEIVEFYNDPRLLYSGFRVRLKRSLLEQNRPPVIRLFAWDSESVSELIYNDEYPWEPDGAFQISELPREQPCTPNTSGLILVSDEVTEDSIQDGLEKLLRHKALGAGRDLIFPPSAFSELVGRPEEQLESQPGEFSLQLDSPDLLDSVGTQGTFAGAEVRGTVSSLNSLPETVHLLVTLNGTVTTILPLVEESGEKRFVGVLPERAEGLDRLSFYLVWSENAQLRVTSPIQPSKRAGLGKE